ncbi:MOSC domain-containing protein [Methylomagnum ishizawai]|uniref:MOSC domain-containing protein n=1 Tax=Methylomagnum ishizawai TaxID=1760988 RepID=UPI001C340B7B|nr:MOSC domain-containing protein [Methylomagnum ishizawai]BBL74523.1 molybdenum cofactor biosysynthesis protein [Methylomagnum ishizawai]
MELLAISLAPARLVEYQRGRVSTGIFKEPVAGPVRVGPEGLEGDVQVDRENHGGPDKAVYAYSLENYRHWEQALGRTAPFPYGQFGENLTVTGLPDEAVHIGDIFQVGGIRVQVTQPRVPCFKLGLKMGDPRFVAVFRHSGRVGFYLRVLEGGEIEAGAPIVRVGEDPAQVNIRDAMLAVNKGPRQREFIDKVLAVPALSLAWREELTQRRAG